MGNPRSRNVLDVPLARVRHALRTTGPKITVHCCELTDAAAARISSCVMAYQGMLWLVMV